MKYVFPLAALVGAIALCFIDQLLIGFICLIVAGISYSEVLNSDKHGRN